MLLELIFTAQGEVSTRLFSVQDDAQGFMGNRETAQKGGRGAGNARENFEKTTGQKVVSEQNYLKLLEEAKEGNVLGEPKT